MNCVARAVVATASCTVQIVRDAGEDHSLDSGRRVLLATDGSKTSAQSKVRNEKEAQEAVSSAEQVLASAGLKATAAVLSVFFRHGKPMNALMTWTSVSNVSLRIVQ